MLNSDTPHWYQQIALLVRSKSTTSCSSATVFWSPSTEKNFTMVDYRKEGLVAIFEVNNPPVNSLRLEVFGLAFLWLIRLTKATPLAMTPPTPFHWDYSSFLLLNLAWSCTEMRQSPSRIQLLRGKGVSSTWVNFIWDNNKIDMISNFRLLKFEESDRVRGLITSHINFKLISQIALTFTRSIWKD